MAYRHQVYNGDQLLYLIAKDRLNRGALKGVVGTLMTNFAIEKQFKTLGVPFHRAKVGDRYVLEVMLKEGIDLGGEGSGHLTGTQPFYARIGSFRSCSDASGSD